MKIWLTAGIVLVILAVLFVALCRVIGKKFLRNLARKNPGEKFTADLDVSFYEKSPVRKLAEEGMAWMQTLPQEDVYMTSRDGLRMHATLFPAEEHPKKIVVGIHGFQSHAWNEFAPHIAFYRSLGFSMLLPDDRAHGLSEGTCITMGVKDRLDCIDWCRYLVDRYGADVRLLLHGVSMGGAAVLAASGEDDLPKQVFGVVSDCGFSCVQDALTFQLHSLFHMPAALPLRVCAWYARHRAGFDFREGRPIDQVRKARVPLVLIQGTDDPLVPKEMAEELYNACCAPKKLLLVEHATHADSVAIDPEGYHRVIREQFGI